MSLIEKIINESQLMESSMSRIYRHILEFNTAIISAHRAGNSSETNKLNTVELKSILLKNNFGITAVLGTYIEQYNSPLAKEVKENSFFVVNMPNKIDFLNLLTDLGIKYNQDSVIFVEKGGGESYLLGTNKTGYPGMGITVSMGKFKPKNEGEFMTRINNQPFTFGEGLETYNSLERLSRLAISKIYENYLKNK